MSEDIGEYFDFLYSDTTGYVYAPAKDPSSGRWDSRFFQWPAAKKDLIDYCLSVSSRGLESYVAPALFKSPANALKGNLLGTHVVWTEFDGNAETAISEMALEGVASATDPQSGTSTQEQDQQGSEGSTAPGIAMPAPSLRVQSSRPGHEHVYWRLNEFVSDIASIEDINRSISYRYGSDHSGWDATQILRPPGTKNYKRNLPVEISEWGEGTINLSAFAGLPRSKELVRSNIESGDIPDITAALASAPAWDAKYLNLLFDEVVKPGDRSTALMNLGYYAAELGMSDEAIYSVLDTADKRLEKFTGRSDRTRRLADIVNKARQKHPRGLADLMLNPTLQVKSTPGTKTVYGLQEFLDTKIHINWLLKNLLEQEGYGIFSSAPGVGKTTLGIELAASLALGRGFFHFDNAIDAPVKTLFLSLELAHGPIKWFFENRAKEPDFSENMDRLQENLMIAPVGNVLSLESDEGKKFLENLISEYKPSCVIVDSLGAITSSSLTDDVAMRKLFSYLQAVRQRYGVSFVFIHHNRKASGDNKKPVELADVIGSTYITAPADFVFTLWAPDEDHVILRQVKARFSRVSRQLTLHRNSNLKFTVTEDTPKSSSMKIEPLKEGEKGAGGFKNPFATG